MVLPLIHCFLLFFWDSLKMLCHWTVRMKIMFLLLYWIWEWQLESNVLFLKYQTFKTEPELALQWGWLYNFASAESLREVMKNKFLTDDSMRDIGCSLRHFDDLKNATSRASSLNNLKGTYLTSATEQLLELELWSASWFSSLLLSTPCPVPTLMPIPDFLFLPGSHHVSKSFPHSIIIPK
jgi:hypothetical protein